ncbi:MAG: hypothetical protein NVSMB42_18080 [Herpetosiphon sp.]
MEIAVQLRVARTSDLAAVAAMSHADYLQTAVSAIQPSSHSESAVPQIVTEPRAGGIIVATVNERIVGAARYCPTLNAVEVTHLAVDPAWEGNGIASSLVRAVEEWSELLGYESVEVAISDAANKGRNLFKRLGYCPATETAANPSRNGRLLARRIS